MTKPLLSKKMFPVSLLLEGRSCLVIGGGRVAARKTAKLAEAGAAITVIAPSIRTQIKQLDGVVFKERAFEESDLDDVYLVFALTDDAALNRHIVECCRKQGRLCSAADGSWINGDLTMPASFSEKGLTVAVSTSGQACRRSRLLRESLSRHVAFLQDVDLFMIGGDSNTLGIEGVEALKAQCTEIEKILPCIQGVHEFMILSTCNRFEILGLVSNNTDLELFLKGFPAPRKGMAAFRRFAEITAGIHSGILGETRIVAQVKEALSAAQQNGWAGSFLQGWTDQTLRISKEIRHATAPHIPALEIEDLVLRVLEQSKSHTGPLRSEKILLIGRGEIGRGLAKKLEGATQINGRDENELRALLPDADVVICATGNPNYVIRSTHQPLLKDRATLLDLSLPRNIDPTLPGVVDLSTLRSISDPEVTEKLFTQAKKIIESYAAEYQQMVQFENRAP